MSKNRVKQLALVAAVLTPLVYLSSRHEPLMQFGPVAFLRGLVYPAERFAFELKRNTQKIWWDYIYLVQTTKENRRLRAENASLKTKLLNYEEIVLNLDQAKRLLGLREQSEQELLAAEIISTRNESTFHSLRIHRGSDHGLRIGMPVINEFGLVGRIFRVGKLHADVLTVFDPNFHVDSLIQRTRFRGIVSGAGYQKCIMHISNHADVRIGDRIQSSGLVGSFPKGILVGKVIKIAYSNDRATQIVTIETGVKLDQIEDVFVVLQSDPYIERILETAGQNWFDRTTGAAEGVGF
jgi:rod shape-determining protein MreC